MGKTGVVCLTLMSSSIYIKVNFLFSLYEILRNSLRKYHHFSILNQYLQHKQNFLEYMECEYIETDRRLKSMVSPLCRLPSATLAHYSKERESNSQQL